MPCQKWIIEIVWTCRQLQPGAVDWPATFDLLRAYMDAGVVEISERGHKAIARHPVGQILERNVGMLQERSVRAAWVGVDRALHQPQKRPLALAQAPSHGLFGLIACDA